MVCKEHLGEGRHPHQEVQHSAAVGVVGAIVVGLHGGHGVVLAYALPVLLLQVLRGEMNTTVTPPSNALCTQGLKKKKSTYLVVSHVAVLFLLGLHGDGLA